MSYTIDYNRAVFECGDDKVLALWKRGDNNTYTYCGVGNQQVRSRDWGIFHYGSVADFWIRVGQLGGVCEGGSLQRAKGWSETSCMTIEQYIAVYRKAFRKRLPLRDLRAHFSVSAEIKLMGDKDNERPLESFPEPFVSEIQKLFVLEGRELRPDTWYGDKMLRAYGELRNKEDLIPFLDLYKAADKVPHASCCLHWDDNGRWKA